MTDEIIFSLGDRTKHDIYDNYSRLYRQCNEYLSARPNQKKYAKYHIKRKFLNFYSIIYPLNQYKHLRKEWRDKFDGYKNDVNSIKDDDDVNHIQTISMEIMKELNLMNISFTSNKFGL